MTVSANAQTKGLAQSKFTDNWYIGIQGGVATKTTGSKWLKNLDANAGLRIGKNISPIFGLAVEGNAYFSNRPWTSNGTVVRAVNANLLGTVNLMNLFAGYQGEPRAFEITAIYGLGYLHCFGNKSKYSYAYVGGNNTIPARVNRMTSKAALDFQFNFGDDKQYQIYVEPSMNWAFLGQATNAKHNYGYRAASNVDQPGYNINNSFFQVNAGFIYKFNNSYGSHNFKLVDLRDQAEIDALNARINQLQDELARKPKEVIKEVVKEAPVVKEVNVAENLVFVTFAQGKSALTKEAKAALDEIKEGTHVQIVGTASPEGSAALNQKLSQARADNTAEYLKSRGVIVDEATGKGVQGTTSNRLAIVYVK